MRPKSKEYSTVVDNLGILYGTNDGRRYFMLPEFGRPIELENEAGEVVAKGIERKIVECYDPRILKGLRREYRKARGQKRRRRNPRRQYHVQGGVRPHSHNIIWTGKPRRAR